LFAASERTGRDGFLRLRFERRGARTVLAERRFALPLEVLAPMPLDPGGAAVLFLLNPTGGVLGGDRLETEVELGPGAEACLVTPSATKVYRAAGPPAEQRLRARVGPGALFEHVPDHVIPSPGAALRAEVDVELAPGGAAILWDALAVGRLARGEAWRFASIESETTVRDALGRRFRERFRLEPARRSWAGIGGLEGMGYLGTFLACFDGDPVPLAAALDAALAGLRGVRGGASPLGRGGVFARVIAAGAPELADALRSLWTPARRALCGRDPPDLRKA
jgi:urease accessory protein